MKISLSKWFGQFTYFLFWVCFGFFGWTYSFEKTTDQSLLENELASHAPASTLLPVESSFDTAAENESFFQELKTLEAGPKDQDHTEDYAMSPEQVEDYEHASDGSLYVDEKEVENFLNTKKKFNFENVSADDLNYLVTPEDSNACGDGRNYIEKSLKGNARLAPWLDDHKAESKLLPKKCIAFVMNSFPEIATKEGAISFKKQSSPTFSKCPSGSSGGPLLSRGLRVKNPVPCVSKNLVNATYNAYVDVMACLKIDPKDLLPKIYNESGFYINALGGGMDGGIGQLTKPAIDQVNEIFPKYFDEINKAALANPDGACARIIKNKVMIMPVKSDAKFRCQLLWPAENPLRNILYAGLLTRYNMKYVSGISFEAGEEMIVDGDKKTPATGTASDALTGKMKELEIGRKLAELGMKNPNLHDFQKMITLAGYNSGIGSAMIVFNNYLDQRISANQKSKTNRYNLKESDFDFIQTQEKVKEARSYVMSSFIKPGGSMAQKIEMVKKRKQFPGVWGSAYTRSFPEYIVLILKY